MKKEKSKSINIFSNFDLRVLVVFILILLVGLFFFFVKLNNYVDCDNAKFFVIAEKFATGEIIQFDSEISNADKWEWDFGDGSPIEKRQQALHRYQEPGIYTVSLTINGSCSMEKQIEIKSLGEILNQARVPKIVAPKSIKVGEPVRFKYKYKGEVFSWEWSFGESGRLDKTEPAPVYMYLSPGKKTISLIVNGDVKHIAKQTVFVKPREIVEQIYDDEEVIEAYVYEKEVEKFELPPGDPQKDPMEEFLDNVPLTPMPKKEKRPEEPKKPALAPDISEEQFELMILQVAAQAKTKEDFAQYICDDFEIPVVKNSNKIISFAQFCKSIQGKEIKIDNLRLTKDHLNCIDGFSIDYKVKKFFIWHKDK
ncbi:PKD domain-containing protein [Rapidithrix thailandica]|uniref:PKD domain-containing protein n=1 Tax=Rapidithrix thailandica TaxID=413964 RepID=A0AAW9SJI1_9BACT